MLHLENILGARQLQSSDENCNWLSAELDKCETCTHEYVAVLRRVVAPLSGQ